MNLWKFEITKTARKSGRYCTQKFLFSWGNKITLHKNILTVERSTYILEGKTFILSFPDILYRNVKFEQSKFQKELQSEKYVHIISPNNPTKPYMYLSIPIVFKLIYRVTVIGSFRHLSWFTNFRLYKIIERK